MERVSRAFDEGTMYLPQVVLASKAMEAAMEVVEQHMDAPSRLKGIIVMGTVKGDIHCIGKNVCCAMLRGAGFKVIDTGADTSPEKFVEAVVGSEADVVAGSALMTISLPQQKEIVRSFDESGVSVLKVFGGAPCTKEWVDEIGGDGYSASAPEIVRLVCRLLNIS